jgi:AraC family transcriptional regulator, exoenzyme S synthesis regulatory protein ExsA
MPQFSPRAGVTYNNKTVNLNMLMKADKITSCYLGPSISPEQFIQEHFFVYLIKGAMHGYDGHRYSTLQAGECCMVRKNHLARYNKQKDNGQFEKVIVVFDEQFLRNFNDKHRVAESLSYPPEAFLRLKQSELIPNFINSLAPYYSGGGKIDVTFADLKREELLLILLKSNPELKRILFDFGMPQRIDLQEFMNRNFKFNVSLERFAYLTGRSLSVFKKDFAKILGETPSRWLVKKRLQEAHFQLSKEGKRPTEIYLDLGFEDLSHFSFAFKKLFGKAPNEFIGQSRATAK